VRVEVRAFATIRSFLPSGARHTATLDVPDASTIADLTGALGIPRSMAVIALLNGREAEPGQTLSEHDVVTLFPPLAGGRIGPLVTR
jgi:molybdopterin converting factor small subunit